ncbi:hypothetical protein GW17_00006925, partial [Ensete ventricosum]
LRMSVSNEKWIDGLQFSSLFWPPPQDENQRQVGNKILLACMRGNQLHGRPSGKEVHAHCCGYEKKEKFHTSTYLDVYQNVTCFSLFLKAQVLAYVEYFSQFTSEDFPEDIAQVMNIQSLYHVLRIHFLSQRKEEKKKEYLASARRPRPRVVAARGRRRPRAVASRGSRALFLPRGEKDRGDVSFSLFFNILIYLTRFIILTCTARYGRYIPVRQVTGTRTARYWAVLSKIDFRQPIEEEIDRRRSIEEEKGKKKRKRKKKEEGKKKYLARSPSSPAAAFSPTRGDGASPRAGRQIEATCGGVMGKYAAGGELKPPTTGL